MQDDILFDKIEDYLSHRLAPDEARSFEAAIASDADLAELVRQHRAERAALFPLAKQKLIALMQGWEQEMPDTEPLEPPAGPSDGPGPKSGAPTTRWVVGIALLLLPIGWWAWKKFTPLPSPPPIENNGKPATETPKNNQTPTQPIAIEEVPKDTPSKDRPKPKQSIPAQPSPTPATNYIASADTRWNARQGDFQLPRLRGVSASLTAVDSAKIAFSQADYPTAVSILRRVLGGAVTVPNQYLLAHAYFKNHQFSEAAPLFKMVAVSKMEPYKEPAEWCYALSLLAMMPATASELDAALQQIGKDPTHVFFTPADALKRQLGGF